MSLPKDDVIITTACVAFWQYEDIDQIVKDLSGHFGKNFYLEVQYHNTDKQIKINEHIIKLSSDLNVPLIMGCDSHYIYEQDAIGRSDYLASKEMFYPDEEGWWMDYPDGETAYKRFAQQCVLSHEEIIEAITNTNIFLDVEDYQSLCFTQDIKMPTLYPGWSQEEKDKLYESLIYSRWEKEKQSVPSNRWPEYEEEIRKEINIVKTTKHADYFLVDTKIVERAKELGGVITLSGRGSGVSFYTNKLLGLTDVDRIAAPVKMYPERFMSSTRILEAKTLADLDLNVSDQKPFAQAQIDVLGAGHSEPMISYGTMKKAAAWKLYAKSQNIPFDVANEISLQLKKYDEAYSKAEEDEKEDIDVLDYLDPEYHELYERSKVYHGVISDWKIAPCSYLLYQGDIRKEIGLVRTKEHVCCLMDGKWAEEYKFLKNDLLRVAVVELIDKTYKRIGIKPHTTNELLALCTPDDPVWDVYKKGATMAINQVEKPGTSSRVAKYKPTNISELCAFIAAIRPGFKSMYKIFESREPFNYGIPAFDKLIQTKDMPDSFVLYQEMAMATLHYAGIEMSECYEAIKNIAKKRVEKVVKLKERFIPGFAERVIKDEDISIDEANEIAERIWKIIEDSSHYSFNASHSYCVAIDSLYCAYLKSHYPLEFYEVLLNILNNDNDKDRMVATKTEAESYFDIKFPPFRYGQNNSRIVANLESREITNTLQSIKGFGKRVGIEMYESSKGNPKTFIDVLKDLDHRGIKASIVKPLIQMDYFCDYGNIRELSMILNWWDILKQGDAKQLSKNKVEPENIRNIFEMNSDSFLKTGESSKTYLRLKTDRILYEIQNLVFDLNMDDVPIMTKIENQKRILGYVSITTNKPEDRRKLIIMDIHPLRKDKYTAPWGYVVISRSIGTGKRARLTVKSNVYDQNPIQENDIVYAHEVKKNKTGYWYLWDYDILI